MYNSEMEITLIYSRVILVNIVGEVLIRLIPIPAQHSI